MGESHPHPLTGLDLRLSIHFCGLCRDQSRTISFQGVLPLFLKDSIRGCRVLSFCRFSSPLRFKSNSSSLYQALFTSRYQQRNGLQVN